MQVVDWATPGESVRMDLDWVRDLIEKQSYSVVVAQDGCMLTYGDRAGIADLLDIRQRLGRGAARSIVGDRVVGKAAALIMRSMGVRAVYARLVSDAGVDTLAAGRVYLEYGTRVPAILDRDQRGPCPFEAAVAAIDDPRLAVATLTHTLERLRAGTPPRRAIANHVAAS